MIVRTRGIALAFWSAFASAAVLAPIVALAAEPAGQAVIVPANSSYPALTQHMLDRTTAMVEWAFDVQLTAEQRRTHQQFAIDKWRKGDAKEIGSVLQLVETDQRVSAMTADERAKAEAQVRPDAMLSLTQAAAEGDEEAQWMMDVLASRNDRPVVEGDGRSIPPLTPRMLGRYCEIISLAFDTRLTKEQRRTLEDQIVAHWRNRDAKDIEAITGWLTTESQMTEAKLNRAQREMASLEQIYPKLIEQAREEAKTDPEVKWILAIHDEYHRPIAGSGETALTRKKAEEFLKMIFFAASVCEGGEQVDPPFEMLEAWTEQLRSNWDQLPAEGKAAVGQLTGLSVKVRALWDHSDSQTQEDLKKSFAQMPQVQEIAGHIRKMRQEAQANAERVARMRKDGNARAEQVARSGSAAAASSSAPEVIGPSHATVPASSAVSSTAAGVGDSRTAAFLKAQRDLYMEQQKTQMISNMMYQMHQTRMMVIYNTGGNGFTWETRYR